MAVRAGSLGALERARETVMASFQLGESNSGVFWGDWAPVGGRQTLESRSPIDGRPLGAIATADADDYERVVLSAQDAFREWARVPAPRRGEIIKLVADELARHKTELGLLVSLEVGKTLTEGLGEIQEMIDVAHFAVGLSRQLYGLTIVSERPDHRLQEQWHPLGPVAVITAFNFPSAVWAWNALIAAVAGIPGGVETVLRGSTHGHRGHQGRERRPREGRGASHLLADHRQRAHRWRSSPERPADTAGVLHRIRSHRSTRG